MTRVTKLHQDQETAFHEAGHAVVAVALGVPLRWASVDELYLDDDVAGHVRVDVRMEKTEGPWPGMRAADSGTGVRLALACLAGLAASRQWQEGGWPWDEDEAAFGTWWSGAFREDDYQRARTHSRFDPAKDGAGADGSGLGPWDEAFILAGEELVEALAPAIEAVADELYTALTLSADEIVELCESTPGWEQGPPAAEAILADVKAERSKARRRQAGTAEARARGKMAEVDRILREARELEARHGRTGPWPAAARRRYDTLVKRGHRLMDEAKRGETSTAPGRTEATGHWGTRSPSPRRRRRRHPTNDPRIKRIW